ncbi:hypothetical protein CSHISOI_07846 [Colletotrichum shisoi]|uniref:Nephrocystin-3 n=1 Tax=Colletotrichum shisoi TaxID=2078593 RepID=A0A5Q4BLC0_9PEZI|nr:hypothetical protein CSHISOI_07846 [Colletotrichum shisoi]
MPSVTIYQSSIQTTLKIRKGPVYTLGNHNGPSKRIEILDLRVDRPQSQWNLDCFLANNSNPPPELENVSVRMTSIWLSSDFRKSKASVVDAIGELEMLIHNGLSTKRKLQGLFKSSANIYGFFIISEDMVAWMVKDIMMRLGAVQPQIILGLVFLESSQPLESFEVNFTRTERGSNLRPVTWALEKSCLAELDDLGAIWPDLLRFSISPRTKERRNTILGSGNEQGGISHGGRWAIQEDLTIAEIRSRHPALESYWDRQSQSKYQRGLVQLANRVSYEGSGPMVQDLPLPDFQVEGYEEDPGIPQYWLQDLEGELVESLTVHNFTPNRTNSLKRLRIDSPTHSPGEGTATTFSDVINATLLMIQGSYHEALSVASRALRMAIKKHGENDRRTLEAAVLTSKLMFKTCRVLQGRSLGKRCWGIIADRFDAKDPLALRATYVLVDAARAEGLFTRALSKSKALAKATSEAPIRGHALNLRCQGQLGTLHICVGNYVEAAIVLSSAFEESETRLGPKHPISMRLQAGLALAQHHLGSIASARRNILAALGNQLHVYLGIQIDERTLTEPTWKQFFKGVIIPRFQMASPCRRAHPDILDSLLTLGKVETGDQDSDKDLILTLFFMVHQRSRDKLARTHELTLDAALALGNALCSLPRETRQRRWARYGEPNEHYRSVSAAGTGVEMAGSEASSDIGIAVADEAQVDKGTVDGEQVDEGEVDDDVSHARARVDMRPRDSHLRINHPTILRAHQAAVTANALDVDRVDDDPVGHVNDSKAILVRILRAQEGRPGPNHPDTLRTMLALLAMQIVSNESRDATVATLRDLLRRLRVDVVRKQRPVECLFLQDRVAQLLLLNPGSFRREAGRLIKSLCESVEQIESEDEDLRRTMKALRKRCDDGLQILKQHDPSSAVRSEEVTKEDKCQ